MPKKKKSKRLNIHIGVETKVDLTAEQMNEMKKKLTSVLALAFPRSRDGGDQGPPVIDFSQS